MPIRRPSLGNDNALPQRLPEQLSKALSAHAVTRFSPVFRLGQPLLYGLDPVVVLSLASVSHAEKTSIREKERKKGLTEGCVLSHSGGCCPPAFSMRAQKSTASRGS